MANSALELFSHSAQVNYLLLPSYWSCCGLGIVPLATATLSSGLLTGLLQLTADSKGLSSLQWKNKAHFVHLYHVPVQSCVCAPILEEKADSKNSLGMGYIYTSQAKTTRNSSIQKTTELCVYSIWPLQLDQVTPCWISSQWNNLHHFGIKRLISS